MTPIGQHFFQDPKQELERQGAEDAERFKRERIDPTGGQAMHPYVKQGIERMREPGRKQGRFALMDKDGNLCALGCIAQSAVEDGRAKWLAGISRNSLVGPDATYWKGDTPSCVREAYQELEEHGISAALIASLNDRSKKSLPEIADIIEERYKGTEES